MNLLLSAISARFANIMKMIAPLRVEQARPIPVMSREMMLKIMIDRKMREMRARRYY